MTLTAKEAMTLMDCLFQYERKVEQGLKEASDISYGWSLLVQEQQHLHNIRTKLQAQLVEANEQGA
jgi:hypothetical protein